MFMFIKVQYRFQSIQEEKLLLQVYGSKLAFLDAVYFYFWEK
jgi:hypothetical protein